MDQQNVDPAPIRRIRRCSNLKQMGDRIRRRSEHVSESFDNTSPAFKIWEGDEHNGLILIRDLGADHTGEIDHEDEKDRHRYVRFQKSKHKTVLVANTNRANATTNSEEHNNTENEAICSSPRQTTPKSQFQRSNDSGRVSKKLLDNVVDKKKLRTRRNSKSNNEALGLRDFHLDSC